jgi:DNA-binding response OmpR family regulator
MPGNDAPADHLRAGLGLLFRSGANLIAVHIARLRKKIDIVPGRSSLIETVKGEGIVSMAARNQRA